MRKLLVILSVVVLLSGCSANKSYEQSMQKAKEAIVEKEFEKAEGFIELALENKKNDTLAKNYQQQLNHFIDGKTKKDTNTEEALVDFEAVIKIKDGPSQIIKWAKEEIKLISNKEKSSDPAEEKQDKNDHQEKTEQESASLWNEEKEESLRNFMSEFSHKMSQSYKEYNQSSNVDLYGLQLPSTIISGDWTMAINNQPVEIEWSETGEGNMPYQLVAIYSDAETQPYLQQHVYFFVIENGQPKVFVTQQNQGNDEKYLHFRESENGDLNSEFSNIVMSDKVSIKETNDEIDQLSSFAEAKEFVLNHKSAWSYGLKDKNETNVEVLSINENHQELATDDIGSYYPIVLNTDDDDGSITGGGKQFRVYTDS